MIIDSHVHVEYKDDGTKFSAKDYLEAMDQSGVDKSLILGVDHGCAGDKPDWVKRVKGPLTHVSWEEQRSFMPVVINYDDERVMEFCKADRKRLIGIASVHPERYRPDLKVKRAVEDFGLKGVKLYPHSGFFLNDRRLTRIYDYCERKGVPVFMHTGIKPLRSHYLKYCDPILADEVATQFPNLKIILLHGGYPWIREYLTVVHSNPNIYADITFLDYIELTFNEHGLVEKTMKQLHKLIGSKRIIWGSEGPFMYLPIFGRHGPEYIKQSQEFLVKKFDFLSEDEKKDILGRNTAKLLELE